MVHLSVLGMFLLGAYKLTHDNRCAALIWFVLAGVVCIGMAHRWYLGIERPTMRLASRLNASAEFLPAALPKRRAHCRRTRRTL